MGLRKNGWKGSGRKRRKRAGWRQVDTRAQRCQSCHRRKARVAKRAERTAPGTAAQQQRRLHSQRHLVQRRKRASASVVITRPRAEANTCQTVQRRVGAACRSRFGVSGAAAASSARARRAHIKSTPCCRAFPDGVEQHLAVDAAITPSPSSTWPFTAQAFHSFLRKHAAAQNQPPRREAGGPSRPQSLLSLWSKRSPSH